MRPNAKRMATTAAEPEGTAQKHRHENAQIGTIEILPTEHETAVDEENANREIARHQQHERTLLDPSAERHELREQNTRQNEIAGVCQQHHGRGYAPKAVEPFDLSRDHGKLCASRLRRAEKSCDSCGIAQAPGSVTRTFLWRSRRNR